MMQAPSSHVRLLGAFFIWHVRMLNQMSSPNQFSIVDQISSRLLNLVFSGLAKPF